MSPGKLISFEGLDGAGKTTQIELLERWLEEQRVPYLRTREPGGTALGVEIRHLAHRAALQRAEFVDRITHRQQRVGLDIARQAEDLLDLVLIKYVQRGQHRTDAEGAARQLQTNRATFVSSGVVANQTGQLGFSKAFAVRDPDAHAIEIAEK